MLPLQIGVGSLRLVINAQENFQTLSVGDLVAVSATITTARALEHLSDDLTVLTLAACPIPPGLPGLCRRDVARAHDEVAEVLALLPLERVVLDHRPQDREDLGL